MWKATASENLRCRLLNSFVFMKWYSQNFGFLNSKGRLSLDNSQVLKTGCSKSKWKHHSHRSLWQSSLQNTKCSKQDKACKTWVWSLNMAIKNAWAKRGKQWIHLSVTLELSSSRARRVKKLLCAAFTSDLEVLMCTNALNGQIISRQSVGWGRRGKWM